MHSSTYQQRRAELQTYFDRTAMQAWARLTSDAPVSRIRATVRAGRNHMRDLLLGWLPADMEGMRVLDAGCGTGALAQAVAQRGAEVLAVDLSASLVELARERTPATGPGSITYRVGDMLSAEHGEFDYVVAMDSLIHYRMQDVLRVVVELGQRTHTAILFTYAPNTPALALMHAVGRLFPRGERAPAIRPVSERRLMRAIHREDALTRWRAGRGERVSSGFYTSQALELRRIR